MKTRSSNSSEQPTTAEADTSRENAGFSADEIHAPRRSAVDGEKSSAPIQSWPVARYMSRRGQGAWQPNQRAVNNIKARNAVIVINARHRWRDKPWYQTCTANSPSPRGRGFAIAYDSHCLEENTIFECVLFALFSLLFVQLFFVQ